MQRPSVLGAGSWGTALANLLAENGYPVRLWARSPDLSTAISSFRENVKYLPGVRLNDNVSVTHDLEDALTGATMVVGVVPSHGLRDVFSRARALIGPDTPVVSATKGIELHTNLPASRVISEALGRGASEAGVSVLSGPSFAREVALGLPTAVCVASRSREEALLAQRTFSSKRFRVYVNSDVTGVELGGALKNVIAIASGISDGLGLGLNSRAALITRSLVEMTRLGLAMGALPTTFSGLSGLGDLVLTCTGNLSRNYTVGMEIGKGLSVEEALSRMNMVAEGVKTSIAVMELSKRHNVEMPISEAVHSVLHAGMGPKEAVMGLMSRDLKEE